MTKKIIFYDLNRLGQLHCDACDLTLPGSIALSEALIGTPCPHCGADMLTRKDYESTRRMLRIVDLLNAIFGPLFGKEEPTRPGDTGPVTVRCHGNTTTIELTEKTK